MDSETLERIVAGVLRVERIHALEHSFLQRREEQFSFSEPLRLSSEPDVRVSRAVRAALEAIEDVETVAFAHAVTYAPAGAVRYAKEINYARATQTPSMYVHIPSWVKVSRAPFHEFGSPLYGLAYPATGAVFIRDDLEGDAFSEVLQHEVFHQLYPSASEQQVRQMTLARFGERATIHHRLGVH